MLVTQARAQLLGGSCVAQHISTDAGCRGVRLYLSGKSPFPAGKGHLCECEVNEVAKYEGEGITLMHDFSLSPAAG